MVENKRGIFISTISQSAGRILGLVFALASVKLLTNYLGVVGTGEYNTITTYLNFFVVIADLGLFSVTVREISKKPEQEKKILANVFYVRLITALIASIIAGAIVFLTKYNDHIKIGTLIALGFLFFNLVWSIFDIVFQYRLKMQYSAIAEFLGKFVMLVALFLVIRNHGSFYWVVSTISISALAGFLIKWYFSGKFIKFHPEYDHKVASWIVKAAIPLGAVFIVNNLFFKIDTLMLFMIKGAAAVGIYSVAYKVLEVTIFAGSYFASSLKPTLSQNMDVDNKSVKKLINKSFSVMLLISFPIAIICTVFSKEIIIFLSNSDFVSGSKALVFLGFTLPLIYLDVLLGEILIAKDARKLLINIAIFILILNVVLNLILIPIFSFIGAAIVTLISELVLFLVNYYYTKKILGYEINWNTILKILLISALTLFFGLMIKVLAVNFLILIALTLLAYAALAFVFKLVSLGTIKDLAKEGQE